MLASCFSDFLGNGMNVVFKGIIMKTKKGFTLVELLVVIAVIALLMSILMPALGLARDHAMRVVCGSKESQLVKGFMMYADENKQKLITSGGWLDGIEKDEMRAFMKAMGINIEGQIEGDQDGTSPPVKIFYCPSNTSTQRDMDNWWNFRDNYGLRSWHIFAYSILLENDPTRSGKPGPARDLRVSDEKDPAKNFISRMDCKRPAEAELVVDKVMENTLDGPLLGHFDNMDGHGSPGGSGEIVESSSHLKDPLSVHGSNIGFVDGHVEWRNFKELRPRYQNGPTWWW